MSTYQFTAERVKEMTKAAAKPDALFCQDFIDRCAERLDESGEKKLLARALNIIMARVRYSLETGGDETDIEFAANALDVIAHVADLENLKREEAKAHV